MWFKNAQIHPLQSNFPYQPEKLADLLQQQTFQPCGSVSPHSLGWIAPIGEDEAPLVHGSNGCLLFCLKIEEKLLPAGVVKEQHEAEVKAIETQQGKKLFRDEKQRLKEELYHSLLSKAFTRSQRIYAYIDTRSQQLIIDTSSDKRAEQFLKLFRHCASAIGITRHEITSPRSVMTQWLQSNRYPGGFSITEQCVLEEPKDRGGVARFQQSDLLGDGVKGCLEQGSQVISLGLNWRDQIRFNLKHDFTIASIKFLDIVQELARDGLSETNEDREAADFAIMSETLAQFFKDLLTHFVDQEAAIAC